LFGGGHISIGEAKRRSSGIAKALQDRASNVMASYLTGGKQEDEYDDEVDEKTIQIHKQESEELIELNTSKDVFEFESN